MWLYDDRDKLETPPENCVGFVYEIINHNNDRHYIGKKLFYFSKSKKIKGKTKRFKIESDWRIYTGSNDELNNDIKNTGTSNMSFKILCYCKTKSEMSYIEAKEQFIRGCLESDKYYNAWVMIRVRKSQLGNFNVI
jgi:hypothetical protein